MTEGSFQKDHRVKTIVGRWEVMEVWVGASLAIPWWESEEEGLVCGFCLSVCLYLCLMLCSPTVYGANCTARERITVQAERESEMPSLQ